mmetsp:Transcript_108675/g.316158  ORF Transcript_108675/g.316158 Transcript_108675/m.316158 type:complete len:589 (-) Transcript_108675:545-2311(-)
MAQFDTARRSSSRKALGTVVAHTHTHTLTLSHSHSHTHTHILVLTHIPIIHTYSLTLVCAPLGSVSETLEICESGVYTSAGGVQHDISRAISAANAASCIYGPNQSVSWRGQAKARTKARARACRRHGADDGEQGEGAASQLTSAREHPATTTMSFEVLNCTTMAAARLLADELFARDAGGGGDGGGGGGCDGGGSHDMRCSHVSEVEEEAEAEAGAGAAGVGDEPGRSGGSSDFIDTDGTSVTERDPGNSELQTQTQTESEDESNSNSGSLDDHRANVAVLNFASGRRPGGGFVKGGVAQEEDNCLCSSLYPCLSQDAMSPHYAANAHETKGGRGGKGGGADAGGAKVYTDSMILSPAVPIFRDGDTHELLDRPFLASVISAPAVNCRTQRHQTVVSQPRSRKREGGRRNVDVAAAADAAADAATDAATDAVTDEQQAVRAIMLRRMRRVLAIAATHGHTHLVLGAWGCGVFKGDDRFVASTWMELLVPGGEFGGVFERVVFAILAADGDIVDGRVEAQAEETTIGRFRSIVADWLAGRGKRCVVDKRGGHGTKVAHGQGKGGRKGRGGDFAWRKSGCAGKKSGHED